MGNIYYARCQAIRRRGVPSWGVFGQQDEQGGGGLIDIGVHQIDLTWCADGQAQARRRQRADLSHHRQHARPLRASSAQWDWKTYTVEDFACGLVRFANGATMSIECGFIVTASTVCR